ncbi:shikimate kinase [Microbacterium chocolatum]|uniref:shikimate kinase n=1 Tax=Microbacterium aurantiacum TaxID=162393 RepID=UPI00338E78D5
MIPPERDTLVLVGPMGAGKTSIGRRVARDLGVGFSDTDKIVVRDHGPIPQIFAAHGEARFRELEHGAVAEALRAGGVVALGGGAVLDPRTRALLETHRVVLLTVNAQTVAGRLHGDDRPLLAGDDALERWQRIWAERRPLYDAVADVTFDTSRGPLSRVVEAVASWARSAAAPSSTSPTPSPSSDPPKELP